MARYERYAQYATVIRKFVYTPIRCSVVCDVGDESQAHMMHLCPRFCANFMFI